MKLRVIETNVTNFIFMSTLQFFLCFFPAVLFFAYFLILPEHDIKCTIIGIKEHNDPIFSKFTGKGRVIPIDNAQYVSKTSNIVYFNTKYKIDVDCPLSEYLGSKVRLPFQTAYREIREFYHFTDVYFSSNGEMGTKNGDYIQTDRFWGNRPSPIRDTVACYENVVFPLIKWNGNFGHWIHDALAGLIWIPQWVWDLNPVIVAKHNPVVVNYTLKSIGVDIDKVQVVHFDDKFVFARNGYISAGYELTHGLGVETFPVMREKFAKYYKLESIKPADYICINKKPNEYRYVKNLDEIFTRLKAETNLDWKMLENDFSDMFKVAKTFAAAKILVAPVGSIIFNALYMKPKTGVMMIEGNLADYPCFKLCYLLNMWCIGYNNGNIGHESYGGGNADVSKAIKYTKMVIYAVDNGRWPDNNHLVKALDIERIKKAMGDDMHAWINSNYCKTTSYWS